MKIGNIVVDTIAIGQTYPLNDIYYSTNSAVLDPRSLIVIQEFIVFLKANPNISIEIHGHTDNVGDFNLNVKLQSKT